MQKTCELLTQPDPEKNIIETPDQLPLWDQFFAERNYIVLNTQLFTSLNQAVSDYNLYELDDQLNTAKAIALTAQFFFKKELSTIRSLLHQSLMETDKDVSPVSKRGHEGGNDSARLRRKPLDGNSN